MSKHTSGYEITRDGRIFSVAHNWRGYGRRQLTPSLNCDGYPSVRITVNGRRTRYAVHVLVAQEYLPAKPSGKHEIRHLDGNKMNSAAENLAWGTKKIMPMTGGATVGHLMEKYTAKQSKQAVIKTA